jgi:hypothetical protein
MAENGQRAGARPVALPDSIVEHVPHQVEILAHRRFSAAG